MGMERAMIPPGALYNNYISIQTLNLIEPPFSKKGGRGALDQKPRQQGIKAPPDSRTRALMQGHAGALLVFQASMLDSYIPRSARSMTPGGRGVWSL